MTSQEIRQQFLDFFASKEHKIVPSAPIVNKDDPTLMFTNAGMNQFKDFFLGNQVPDARRIADTQKCMRVSGKHNDLEDVGRDGTHHTMFEMLGNWSIGDYFKKEAIAWSWEFLTERLGLDASRIYATVFEGDQEENLASDEESRAFWKQFLPDNRIINGNKKDNFWEMGATGPCGPCTEIHFDLRSDEERQQLAGEELVNKDHPLVVEIWNNVFIQFNRKADGSLENLPEKHVDTGMGFERLCMVMQKKTATYDTDVFTPLIKAIEEKTGKKYTSSYEADAKSDMAMRVIADHIRAVAFAIADGQLPSSNGAGYVIRRILRRAVRYYYSFLDVSKPFLYELLAVLVKEMGSAFPELKAQEQQLARIIESEEKTFLNTLENGLKRFDNLQIENKQVSGKDAFVLYDTYGFPSDLTMLLAEEKGYTVDEEGFKAALNEQKERARADAQKEVGDWTTLLEGAEVEFVGYDHVSVDGVKAIKYRTVKVKNKDQYQVVLNRTPFYAESGGQVGDTGLLWFGEEKIPVIDTQKENDLIIHIVKKFPGNWDVSVKAEINTSKRQATASNHTAVHLMHAALHQILGEHAVQKGQNVDADRLRFDFNHFGKVTEEEIAQIEEMVNDRIRQNIPLEEERAMPIEDAKALGAMMLFGEKYGEFVRVITFDKDFSQELCGGTHVDATGEIGYFKILAESGVAAGIRRIEAITGDKAQSYINKELDELNNVRALLKNPKSVVKSVESLQEENKGLKKAMEQLLAQQANALKGQLLGLVEEVNGIQLLATKLPLNDTAAIKNLAYQLEKEIENAVIIFGAEVKGKPQLMVVVNKALSEDGKYHAGNMIRELAKEIKGGGGGQPFFATAGGKEVSGLDAAIAKAKTLIA
ncbi:MAG: alanine--tRNA ligase [Saprospiraceae bacterium]|nr:alanine--tRNA ligase [Saprospiraceae bacterium]